MGRRISAEKIFKGDSRGFTLIELILTIAVLGIITIPLFSYFTEAGKHNARNRRQQNATVAAQDVLEEFKNSAYSLDDCNVVCSVATGWSVKTPPAADGKYTLQKSMKIDNSTFTVDADITPVGGVASTDGTMGMDYIQAVIGSMDTDHDVLASDNGLAFHSAQLYFQGCYTSGCASRTPVQNPDNTVMAGIPSNLSCTIEVEADAQGPGEDDDITMKVNYVYRYSAGVTPDGIDLTGKVYKETVSASSIVAKNLNNIYLFYKTLTQGETIKFKSNSNFSSAVKTDQLKLFVIAQSSVAAGKPKPTGFTERTPSYRLTLMCTATGAETNSFNNKISTVYTNLSQNPPEITMNGDALIGKLKTETGNTDYTIVDKEAKNRVIKIKVSVVWDSKTYATVEGSKVQN